MLNGLVSHHNIITCTRGIVRDYSAKYRREHYLWVWLPPLKLHASLKLTFGLNAYEFLIHVLTMIDYCCYRVLAYRNHRVILIPEFRK
jgi:hypothetical protein